MGFDLNQNWFNEKLGFFEDLSLKNQDLNEIYILIIDFNHLAYIYACYTF